MFLCDIFETMLTKTEQKIMKDWSFSSKKTVSLAFIIVMQLIACLKQFYITK